MPKRSPWKPDPNFQIPSDREWPCPECGGREPMCNEFCGCAWCYDQDWHDQGASDD